MIGDLTLRETFRVNRAAIDIGASPPACVEWDTSSGLDPDEPCWFGDPIQRVDHQRMQAFFRLMYEIGQA